MTRGLGGESLSAAEFRRLAATHRVIPVTRRLIADAETPVGLYRKLAGGRPGTFLLESSGGGTWARYSFIGAGSVATLTEKDSRAYWIGRVPEGLPREGDPVEVARRTIEALATPRLEGLPPLTSGLVGFFGWDAVRRWETLGVGPADDLGVPEIGLMLASELAVFDHLEGTVMLIANAINMDNTDLRVDEAYRGAVDRLDSMTAAVTSPAPSTVAVADVRAAPEAENRTAHADYIAAIEEGKRAIVDGQVFQVVLGQRFDVDCGADPLDVYRILRGSNPSPYMYLLSLAEPDGTQYSIVGSSPEALVKVTGSEAITHPIAGSRPRGANPEADHELGVELLADAKERSEHLMLVDLSRNDLSKVCEPGTVEVVEFMEIERYSHIMHLVSTVVGRLEDGRSAFDVLAAAFPAGTLSGAPKPRALRLIDTLEPAARGVYGGVVGYLDFTGDMDMAIAIRTAYMKNGTAHVSAGGGIVADSVPESEVRESENKAAAVLRALAVAETLRTP